MEMQVWAFQAEVRFRCSPNDKSKSLSQVEGKTLNDTPRTWYQNFKGPLTPNFQ